MTKWEPCLCTSDVVLVDGKLGNGVLMKRSKAGTLEFRAPAKGEITPAVLSAIFPKPAQS